MNATTQTICPTCGEEKPFTGSCGTAESDTRALCKRSTTQTDPLAEIEAFFTSGGVRTTAETVTVRTARFFECLDAARAQLVQQDRVPMPTNAQQAEAMQMLGLAWLESNAPDRLKQLAAPAPGVIPAGWKLVPVEPTPEMVNAGCPIGELIDYFDIAKAYRAMLTVAPAAHPDADPNAPWLTLAHTICNENMIAAGHITERLNSLRSRLDDHRAADEAWAKAAPAVREGWQQRSLDDAAHVEAFGEVIDTPDGKDVRWIIEGGLTDVPEGTLLLVSDKQITGGDGSGDVFAAIYSGPEHAATHVVKRALELGIVHATARLQDFDRCWEGMEMSDAAAIHRNALLDDIEAIKTAIAQAQQGGE